MGGFAAMIGGAGQAAKDYTAQTRFQNFAHQENSLKQLQEQYNNLADALEKTKAQYSAAPDIVDRLNDVEMQIRAAHMPGAPVDAQSFQKLMSTYLKAKQDANAAWATHPNNPVNRIQTTPAVQQAVAQATGQAGVPPVGPQATPPPFAPQIAPPAGPPAAQPPTSPVQPAAQGGGNSSPAPFRSPAAPPVGPSTGQPVPPISAGAGPVAGGPSASGGTLDSSVPPISVSTGGAAVAPVVNLDDLLARSQAGYQSTGIMSPQLHEALTHQMGTQAALEQLYRAGGINLQLGKNKLQAIQPMLDDMHDHPENLMKDIMGIETLTGGGGGAMALGPLLSAMAPQSEPGMTTAGSLEATHPGFLATQGLVNLDPNTPIRVQVNKYTRQPVSAQVSSVAEQTKTGAEGTFTFNPRTGKLGDNLGITPIGMAPTTSVQNIPGQLPQVTTRTKGAPAKTGAPAPIPPVGGGGAAAPRSAAPAGGGSGGSSVIANNYNDWVAGKGVFSDKEQTAMRDYARRTGQPTPETLEPSALKAIATVQPILDEIIHAQQLLKERKLDTMSEADSKIALGKAYGKYAYLKVDDPLAKAISDLSFDSLRSVGQALQGTGSRAYPIFVRGLEHTPVIGLNSDSGKLIADKLEGMRRRVEESIAAAKTETKSGVVPIQPVQAGGGHGPAIGTVEDGYRFKGGDAGKAENWERVH